MAMSQESLTFRDVFVDFILDEWQQVDSTQKNLYRDVMMENYSHMISVGYVVTKADVIFRLRQEEARKADGEPTMQSYPEIWKVGDQRDNHKESQDKPLCQVALIDK